MMISCVSSQTFGADLTHAENMIGLGGRFLEAVVTASYHVHAAESRARTGSRTARLLRNLKRFYALRETLANDPSLCADKRAKDLFDAFPASANAAMEIAVDEEAEDVAVAHEQSPRVAAQPRTTAPRGSSPAAQAAPATPVAMEAAGSGAAVEHGTPRLCVTPSTTIPHVRTTRRSQGGSGWVVHGRSQSQLFKHINVSAAKAVHTGVSHNRTPLPIASYTNDSSESSDSGDTSDQ